MTHFPHKRPRYLARFVGQCGAGWRAALTRCIFQLTALNWTGLLALMILVLGVGLIRI